MFDFLNLRQKILSAIIVVLFVLNIFAWKYIFILAGQNYLKVNILDIGQGDSIFIETPQMRHILIDGGPDASIMSKLQKLLPFWEKNLDVIILTHPDADHLNGLLYVLQNYKVDYIVWTGIIRSGSQYEKWLELLVKAKKQGTKIVITKLGDQIKNGDVLIDILHPFTNLTGQDFRPKNQDNDTGVVSHLIYGKNTFLFTADISSVVENEIIDHKINVVSDVLKVSHHGSKFSSSEEFLRTVNSKIAVVSAGKNNKYGHPTSEVLQRLEKFGIRMFRTDRDGTVEVLSDGNNIKINLVK